jgi:hypothetical protein
MRTPLLFACVLFLACSRQAPAALPAVTVQPAEPAPEPEPEPPAEPDPPPLERPAGQQRDAMPADVARSADAVVAAFAAHDFAGLAGMVHPKRGVRFSPYAYVEGRDVVLVRDEIVPAWKSPKTRLWGSEDGSGDPIDVSFADYYRRFVYDVDFAAAPVVGFGRRVGSGNTLDNIAEVYPGAIVVEYHYPGFDEQYAGMDWRSLRLVLVREGGSLWLVGVVHDQWTV